MKDKILLFFYASALVIISSFHNIEALFYTLVLLVFILVFSTMELYEKISLFKRAIFSILLFSISVSLPYMIVGLIADRIDLYDRLYYVLMINIRALDLTLLTFLCLKYINMYKALDFSKSLSLLMVLVSTHIVSYVRTFHEFREAFKSRSISNNLSIKNIKDYLKRVVGYFFDKSRETSEDIYMAMKSRGFDSD